MGECRRNALLLIASGLLAHTHSHDFTKPQWTSHLGHLQSFMGNIERIPHNDCLNADYKVSKVVHVSNRLPLNSNSFSVVSVTPISTEEMDATRDEGTSLIVWLENSSV